MPLAVGNGSTVAFNHRDELLPMEDGVHDLLLRGDTRSVLDADTLGGVGHDDTADASGIASLFAASVNGIDESLGHEGADHVVRLCHDFLSSQAATKMWPITAS